MPTGQHNEYPWRRTHGHHYEVTEPFRRDGAIWPAGFPFQVSIPPAFHWLPVMRTIIYDPGWLIRARNHDADLKREPRRVRTAIRAAWRFFADKPVYPTRYAWLLPFAFLAIFFFTTGTRILRKIF